MFNNGGVLKIKFNVFCEVGVFVPDVVDVWVFVVDGVRNNSWV